MAVPSGGQTVVVEATEVDESTSTTILRVEDVPAFIANTLHIGAVVIEQDDGRRVRWARGEGWS